MPKWVNSDVLDFGIDRIRTAANKMVLLKQYTQGDTYAAVHGTNNIAEVAMSSSDFTLASDGLERTLTTAAGKTATSSAPSGAAPNLHIAFVDTVNSKVLWVTDEATDVVVNAGLPVQFPVLQYRAQQPI